MLYTTRVYFRLRVTRGTAYTNTRTHKHRTSIESKGEKLSQETNGKIFVVIINIEYIAVLGYES